MYHRHPAHFVALALLASAVLCPSLSERGTSLADTRANPSVAPGKKLAGIRDSRTRVPTLYSNGCAWDPEARVLTCIDAAGKVTQKVADDEGNLTACEAAATQYGAGNPMAQGAWGQIYPVGFIMYWPFASDPPVGESGRVKWLECKGVSVDKTKYPKLYALVGAKTPDMQGLFLRGVGGNSVAVGQVQEDDIGAHSHAIAGKDVHLPIVDDSGQATGIMTDAKGNESAVTYSAIKNSTGTASMLKNTNLVSQTANSKYTAAMTTANDGGVETRPGNMAVRYFIRAEE